MLKAVVFDLDGTLLHTIPDLTGSLNRALAQCGLPTHSQQAVATFVGGGIREAIRKAAPDAGEDLWEQVYHLYRTDYPAHCTEKTLPFPGIEAMLEQLTKAGLQLGVLSNKTDSTTKAIIAHYFPSIPFRFVLGRVESRPLKPNPAAAAPVLEALGLPPADVAYVGDSGTDVVFAQAAGMISVAVPWGYRGREELQGAAFLPETAEELGEALLGLRG